MYHRKIFFVGAALPLISQFYGILIYMYYADHAPPHFHAKCGEYEALIDINLAIVIEGNLPVKHLRHVLKWAKDYKTELLRDWEDASANKRLSKIPPLK